MRKLILLVAAATIANLIAVTVFLGHASTATSRATVAAEPDAVSSIPHLPLHTLRPVY